MTFSSLRNWQMPHMESESCLWAAFYLHHPGLLFDESVSKDQAKEDPSSHNMQSLAYVIVVRHYCAHLRLGDRPQFAVDKGYLGKVWGKILSDHAVFTSRSSSAPCRRFDWLQLRPCRSHFESVSYSRLQGLQCHCLLILHAA